jgi:hypothetical protein
MLIILGLNVTRLNVKKMMNNLFSIFFILLFSFNCTENMASVQVDSSGPKVFVLGDDEEWVTQLTKKHPALMITVFDNNMDNAYSKWVEVLADMEDYANRINYDIRGVKLWLNIYWNKNGVIENIGFYLKPNSRNVKPEDLMAFFTSYLKNQKIRIPYHLAYYHNGSATFPTNYAYLKGK